MTRRALAGVIGLMLGLGVGAPIAYSTRVTLTPILSMFVAMATSACVVTLVRRPPWRQADAVESLLRVATGLALGAGLAWLARRFADGTLPFAIPPFDARVTFTEHAALFAACVGLVTGALVGIEETPLVDAPRETPRANASTTDDA